MAGPRARRSPYLNPPAAGKDELARAALGAPINDSDIPSHTPAMSRIPNPAFPPPPALAKLVAKYTDADLHKATKLALKSFVQGQQ